MGIGLELVEHGCNLSAPRPRIPKDDWSRMMDMFDHPASVDFAKVPSEEPIGIVISRGAAVEAPPRLRAYVWSEVPASDATRTRDKTS
jgi:hypothetical protein